MNTLRTIASQFNIPLVKACQSIQDINTFIQTIQNLEGEEGRVVRFSDGHSFKIKAAEYVRLHRMLGILSNEKEFIKLILDDKIDDVLAILPPTVRDEASTFSFTLLKSLEKTAHHILDFMLNIKNEIDARNLDKVQAKKALAVEYVPHHKAYSSLMFKIWDNNLFDYDSVFDLVKNTVYQNMNNNANLEKSRFLFGINWADFYVKKIELDA